jgi:hypothetical protein
MEKENTCNTLAFAAPVCPWRGSEELEEEES